MIRERRNQAEKKNKTQERRGEKMEERAIVVANPTVKVGVLGRDPAMIAYIPGMTARQALAVVAANHVPHDLLVLVGDKEVDLDTPLQPRDVVTVVPRDMRGG